MDIWKLPQTEEAAIVFLQEKGILPQSMKCNNEHYMKLYIKENAMSMWRCNKTTCRTKKCIRIGNWLSGSRLQFTTIIRFIYVWCYELSSVKFCERELKMSKNTVVDWNNYLRDICVEYMAGRGNQKIGGVGTIVEIDESLFSNRKSNTERVLPQHWVFGGICRETGDCFLVKAPNRSFATLLEIIKDRIAEGSIIYSDSWKAYQTTELEREALSHFKVDHSYNFVDPSTGGHMQPAEKLWGSAKWRNKKHRGTAHHHIESYFAEFMWRRFIRDQNPFEEVLSAIRQYWPPQDHM